MCGIVGMVGKAREKKWGETHRILENLMLAAEHRGRDATGFFARTDPYERSSAARKTVIGKDAIPATKFVETNEAWKALRRQRSSAVICHVRLATHGSPADPQNNHPHLSGKLHLVHNGILSSHRELVDRYCLKTESECDSEVLLRIIERSKSIPIGLSLCLLERPGAMVVYDESRDVCFLARDDSRPLWVGRMKNDSRLFFASTSGILFEGLQSAMRTRIAFELLVPLATNYVYSASSSGVFGAVFEDEIRPKTFKNT